METDPFWSISRKISVGTQRDKNGPLGTPSYSEPCAFFSPGPCALGGSVPGSHSLCLAAIFCATQTPPQLYQSKRDGQKKRSDSLEDKESVIWNFGFLLLGFSLSDVMYLYFFAEFQVYSVS